jgi:hypothetical protein
MAEPTQYSFDMKEATIALIKQQGIHEGLWTIGFEITFAAGMFGATPKESKPGAMLQINTVQLVRHTSALEDPKVVDAAIVNPTPSASG